MSAALMRIRYAKLGGHYHCRVFTRRPAGETFAKNGDLVFDEREWSEWVYNKLTGIAEVQAEQEAQS